MKGAEGEWEGQRGRSGRSTWGGVEGVGGEEGRR